MTSTQPRPKAAVGADVPPSDVVLGRRGMAASANPLVTQAAVDVLKQGGNAVDAAVAAAAMLFLVEPGNGHLGGDTFILMHSAKEGRVVALNGSGAAPKAATAEQYRRLGGIPSDGLLAAAVPGTVACWGAALERYGSKPLSELLAPAIDYAREGVPVSPKLNRMLAGRAAAYAKYPDAASVFLPGGEAPAVGSLFSQPLLADSLECIAEHGWQELYTGGLACELVSYSASHGGQFSRDDFTEHRTEQREPLSIDYRGYTIHEQPPVTQGIIVLLALNILKQFDLASYGPASAETVHLQLEALKLAFADRLRYLGDDPRSDAMLPELLSDEHAREQAAGIDMSRAKPLAWPGNIQPDTTYMCVADSEGNMVSYIHSLYAGCAVVMGKTGALMNNRMLGFNLIEGHPNCLAGGKRPIHTLNSYMVSRDGRPLLMGGTPGANWQVQVNLQNLTNLLDFGMAPNEAIDAPRFLIGDQMSVDDPTVRIESRAGEATIAALEAKGHPLSVAGPWGVGSGTQIIARDPESGMYRGATERRRAGNSVLGI